jgi:hypothetical protein
MLSNDDRLGLKARRPSGLWCDGSPMEKLRETIAEIGKRVRWKAVFVWTSATAVSALFWAQAAHLFYIV